MLRLLVLSLLAFPALAQVNLHLEQISLYDLVKLTYGEIAQKSFYLSPELIDSKEPLTLSVKNTQPAKLVQIVGETLRASGFEVIDKPDLTIIRKAKPEDEIIVYRPKYRSAKFLADVVRPLIPSAEFQQPRQQSEPIAEAAQPETKRQNQQRSQPHQQDEQAADQVAFRVKTTDRRKLEKLLADLDFPTGEVLLKAAVFEVGTNRQDGSALELALTIVNPFLGVQAQVGSIVAGNFLSVNLDGKLNAVISALERDNRFKSISRPQVRVRNGAKAEFTVGQDVPILGNTTTTAQGTVQAVEYKPSGIILTATPQIRQNEIELQLHQELSSFITTNTGVNNSPTLTKRAVKTNMTIQPGEVVILAGLQDDKTEHQQSRVPFLGWLTGDQQKTDQVEVLIFIEAQSI